MNQVIGNLLFLTGLLIFGVLLYWVQPIAAGFVLSVFLCFLGYAINEYKRESN